MTEENKELLLRDLCARVPYGVKVQYMNNIFVIDYVSPMYGEVKLDTSDNWTVGVSEVEPYLFPFSSMTKEQREELNKKFTVQFSGNNVYSIHYHSEGWWDTGLELDLQDWLWFINWCYKNHFDIYGLISMGLALDATGLNVY